MFLYIWGENQTSTLNFGCITSSSTIYQFEKQKHQARHIPFVNKNLNTSIFCQHPWYLNLINLSTPNGSLWNTSRIPARDAARSQYLIITVCSQKPPSPVQPTFLLYSPLNPLTSSNRFYLFDSRGGLPHGCGNRLYRGNHLA